MVLELSQSIIPSATKAKAKSPPRPKQDEQIEDDEQQGVLTQLPEQIIEPQEAQNRDNPDSTNDEGKKEEIENESVHGEDEEKDEEKDEEANSEEKEIEENQEGDQDTSHSLHIDLPSEENSLINLSDINLELDEEENVFY